MTRDEIIEQVKLIKWSIRKLTADYNYEMDTLMKTLEAIRQECTHENSIQWKRPPYTSSNNSEFGYDCMICGKEDI